MKKIILACLALAAFSVTSAAQDVASLPFRNPDLPVEQRIEDLLARLTIEEKVALMQHNAPAVPRLGIPAFNWWNEALHGVARTNEKVTVFPQAIAMAATFDAPAVEKMGDMIASEGRALFNEALRKGEGIRQYYGLTYWTPNINIFRDPRWGRGQETYGEDPYLTGEMGAAITRGLQGNDPYYLKSVACAKHYAVHSGPESSRHSFDARPSLHDVWDTYLPAFRKLVVDARVQGVMCAYNRVDGKPCCGNDDYLQDILRNQWKFKGYVTSDCGAIADFASYHKTHISHTVAASDALLSGTDLNCGDKYRLLAEGVRLGLHTERDINTSMTRLLGIQFRLGLYDPQDRVPYGNIGREVIESPAHKEHAGLMARESMVLLQNRKGILPLDPKRVKSIAVVGPNVDNPDVQLANYNGFPTEIITPLKSLQKRLGNKVSYIRGVGHVEMEKGALTPAQIAAQARKSDVILFIGGISPRLEGEEGDANGDRKYGFYCGDRTRTALPEIQTEMLKALKKTGKPVILLCMSGSAVSMPWEDQHLDAILQAWYAGQSAGEAICDVLFGDYSPAGRMPVTVYASDNDLPPFEDYSMTGRTYRYFQGKPLYPFGYGLSYTTFAYSDIHCAGSARTGETVECTVTVKNTGKVASDEVPQLYVVHPQDGRTQIPLCSLKGFRRIHLNPGESKEVTFTLTPYDLALTDENGLWIEQKGSVTLFVGGCQPSYTDGISHTLILEGDNYQVH